MADAGITVVGAGVVGLAVAARLAPHHPDLVLLERRDRHGTETSSRNSEVIHGGMYYATGSLKARLCVEGNRLLYDFCARHEVPHRRTGKLIVAMDEHELPVLEGLLERGRANGVEMRSHRRRRGAGAGAPGAFGGCAPLAQHRHRERARAHGRPPPPGAAGRDDRAGPRRAGGHRAADADYQLTVRTGGTLESFTSERV